MKTISQKIKEHCIKKEFARIFRSVSNSKTEISRGYIVDYSDKFICLQETDDFIALGYIIIPTKTIIEIRNNKADKYYHKIMTWENEIGKIQKKHLINLSSWQDIFKSIRSLNFNVIVECESEKLETFTIGPIKRISKIGVSIQYFNATGDIDSKATKISYKNITKITFDDRYINTFSKYLKL